MGGGVSDVDRVEYWAKQQAVEAAMAREHDLGEEVARFRLPLPVTGLRQLNLALQKLYGEKGKTLYMRDIGGWMVVEKRDDEH